ncbi:unnamed protein product, partial [Iphiclides podalirius]
MSSVMYQVDVVVLVVSFIFIIQVSTKLSTPESNKDFRHRRGNLEMEDPASEDGDFLPRPYQTELEEIATKKNTLIYLPTGSGKTFIAVRLIQRFRKSLDGEWGQGAKRTFFLVNTVPLVKQQQKVISELCPVKGVNGYSGEDRIDFWNKQKWDEELRQYQVIVMTSQILCDMLTHKYVKVSDINLLVCDECHHAIDDHPMRMVMKHFENCPKEFQPRVLGLTATLLNANVNLHRVEENLRKLETTFHATIATVNELGEVLTYSTNPSEFVIPYKSGTITSAAEEAVSLLIALEKFVLSVKLPDKQNQEDVKLLHGQKNITSDPKKTVKQVKNMISSIIEFIWELGIYGGNISVLAYIILLEQLKRRALTPDEELMYRCSITSLVEVRMVLDYAMSHEEGFEKVVKHSSDKVIQLLNVLKEYNPSVVQSDSKLNVNCNKNMLSGIIFVKKRFTAKVLYNLLKDVSEVNQEYAFLKHDFIVGFNINPYNNTREEYFTKKKSQQILLKFCNKDLNCLISTSIIEEGIDVSQCLLVLRFDQPEEYRSYIQSKGRARDPKSSFVILIEEKNHDKFMKKYKEFQKIEQHIQNMLVGKSDTRCEPTAREITKCLYDDEDIPPYVTEHGNRLSAVSAISLLNRYCSCLPHDQYTIITPMWIKEEKMNRVVITILLPLSCPIKEPIKGQPMLDLKNAKRSAALKACQKLHQAGELDPITILPKAYGKVNYEEHDIKGCFLNWPWDDDEDERHVNLPYSGSKRRVRKHARVYPQSLDGPVDWNCGEQTFYLHVIEHQTMFEEPKDSRERALYNILQSNEGYGFLTNNALPKLCDFPMFLSVGELMTSIKLNYAVIKLNLDLFEFIKQFHFFIFDQVLEVAKKFVVFDGTKNNLYVVPVDKLRDGYDINWDVIQKYRDIPPVAPPALETRKSLHVTKDSYVGKVVTPWYRATIFPDRYIVSDVLEYMSPLSYFETDSFGTYADYYMSKYNLEVVASKEQPLLEVRNFGTRVNCLMPRSATIKAFTEKQKKLVSAAQGDDKPKNFAENFIPEFCVQYEFPGVLWYKATVLPSVIHRVFMLLVAEELRVEIAAATNYGQLILAKDENWLPLEVDLQIAMTSLLSQIESSDTESALRNTVDRINNPIDEAARKPLKIISMKESVYQLQKQKIDKEYPWEERKEPIDIERNLSTVTVMDIECYDEFITAPMFSGPEGGVIGSPLNNAPPTSAAILPPPIVYNDKIELLQRRPAGRGPELRELLSAITTANSNDAFDLERAETLGDAFLKYAASLYLFHKFPALNEGQLTNIKCRLIGNRNLYYAGEKVRLGGRMKIESFSPKCDFLVPGFFAPKSVKEFIENNQVSSS